MDPEACLKRVATALENDEFAETCWALLDYLHWRRHGGFEPANGDARALLLFSKLACALELWQGEHDERL